MNACKMDKRERTSAIRIRVKAIPLSEQLERHEAQETVERNVGKKKFSEFNWQPKRNPPQPTRVCERLPRNTVYTKSGK